MNIAATCRVQEALFGFARVHARMCISTKVNMKRKPAIADRKW
jgi:hypothetical protein